MPKWEMCETQQENYASSSLPLKIPHTPEDELP